MKAETRTLRWAFLFVAAPLQSSHALWLRASNRDSGRAASATSITKMDMLVWPAAQELGLTAGIDQTKDFLQQLQERLQQLRQVDLSGSLTAAASARLHHLEQRLNRLQELERLRLASVASDGASTALARAGASTLAKEEVPPPAKVAAAAAPVACPESAKCPGSSSQQAVWNEAMVEQLKKAAQMGAAAAQSALEAVSGSGAPSLAAQHGQQMAAAAASTWKSVHSMAKRAQEEASEAKASVRRMHKFIRKTSEAYSTALQDMRLPQQYPAPVLSIGGASGPAPAPAR